MDVKGVNNGTTNLASLYDGMFIGKRKGRQEGHRFVTGLCILDKACNVPRREPQRYRWL